MMNLPPQCPKCGLDMDQVILEDGPLGLWACPLEECDELVPL